MWISRFAIRLYGMLCSEMEGLSVLESAVRIDLGLQSGELLGFLSSTHDTHLIHFEQGLEQITTADIEQLLDFIIAWVLPETLIVQVCFIELHWGTLIAHHELLEVQETPINNSIYINSNNTYKYHESPSLSARKPEKVAGF